MKILPQNLSEVFLCYRLDGYDKGWQDSGTRRQAFYTNLRPHKYRFEVIACNNDGLWNLAGASASFFIAPAFYQTAWFQVLCYVAAATLAWMFYLVHIRSEPPAAGEAGGADRDCGNAKNAMDTPWNTDLR